MGRYEKSVILNVSEESLSSQGDHQRYFGRGAPSIWRDWGSVGQGLNRLGYKNVTRAARWGRVIKEIKEIKEFNEADLILNIFKIIKLFKFFIQVAQPKLILHFEF